MSFKYDLIGKVRWGNELNDILSIKGIDDPESFLNPNISCLENPYLFDDIEKAKDCVITHINNNSDISILVDTDCDGYSSAALMYQLLLRHNPNLNIEYIIHKNKEHGLNDVIDYLLSCNSKLIIVPDAGTGDSKECKLLKQVGKDVVILDHHKIDKCDNPAIIVNNQLSDKIKDKAMTGVGICYKFATVLDDYYHTKYADDYLDLVAFGMIGDRVDLHNLQCRYLVMKGIEQIKQGTNKNKLISNFITNQAFSMNYQVTINGIGFYINPLMNSLIRLGDYENKCLMFEALCNSDKVLDRKVKGKGIIPLSIQEYVYKDCASTNRKQKELIDDSSNKLCDSINANELNNYPILICNAEDNVDKNSIGLMANRLTDIYQKPCLLMRRKGDYCSGSGRGFDKCEILNFNKWCKDTELFSFVDGHENAFGVGITFNNTYKLFDLLSNMQTINEPTYHVFNEYDDKTIDSKIITNIAKYDYLWGCGVEEPIFLIKNIVCNKYSINLIGQKQNRLEFTYHNIKFVKQTKGNSLLKLYKDILDCGDNIKFDVICKFKIEPKDKSAIVYIEDMQYQKSENKNCFGM